MRIEIFKLFRMKQKLIITTKREDQVLDFIQPRSVNTGAAYRVDGTKIDSVAFPR